MASCLWSALSSYSSRLLWSLARSPDLRRVCHVLQVGAGDCSGNELHSIRLPGELETLCGGFRARLAGLTLTGVGLAFALDAGGFVVLAAFGLREQAVLLHLTGKLF